MTTTFQSVVFQEIQSAAQQTANILQMPNMLPVDEGSLGDFPWFHHSGTNFNAKTFTWLNNLFALNSDGYLTTNGTALTTSLYNVMENIGYVLSSADEAKLNDAVLANATLVNTIIHDWGSTQGAIPSTYTTEGAQIGYVTSQVLTWGAPGLTLAALRNSTNPMALLPNVPIGADSIVQDFMTYLGDTSAVADIQAAQSANNNELNQVRANLDPQPVPTSATAGFMTTVNDAGATQVVVEIDIQESTGTIQNALLPKPPPGQTFTASFTAVQQSSSNVQVTAASGAVAVGSPGDFLVFVSHDNAPYTMFSADGDQTACAVTLTYNGVTTVTPSYAAYAIGAGTGWWDPGPIAQAAAADPTQSGYQFSSTPAYDFSTNGDFGAISRLMISQQPVVTLTYTTSNYASYQETFQQDSSFGVTFLGIPIAGGSQSYYQCSTSYDQASSTVTVTMTPVGDVSSISPTDQLAYVVGAEVVWPGAGTAGQGAAVPRAQ